MEIESVINALSEIPDFGAVKVKFPRKRAFVAYVRRVAGVVVGVECEYMTIPLSALSGVQRIERIEKAYPWA